MPANPHLSDAELDEIEQRANAATPGPWVMDRRSGADEIWVTAPEQWRDLIATIQYDYNEDHDLCEADFAFIAAARTDVPRLIAELREARAVIARAETTDFATIILKAGCSMKRAIAAGDAIRAALRGQTEEKADG